MRFNKQELITLATQPSTKFEKEGILYIRERQEGFFRKLEGKDNKSHKREKRLRNLSCVGGISKVSLERWCRLRGNLLFYFKSKDPWSEPVGVIVLEQCQVRIDPPMASPPVTADGHYPFYLVFDGGLCQALATTSDAERASWLDAIRIASYEGVRAELNALRQCIERRKNHKPCVDLQTWRLQRGHVFDITEVPLCEISLACDNLLCDGHGRPPNPSLAVDVYIPSAKHWIQYGQTEVIERSSNPGFLNTISFRSSDGLSGDSRVRFTVFDVRERISHTAIPLGSACVLLSAIQDSSRLRIALVSRTQNTVGFLTISAWALEAEDRGSSTEHTPCRGSVQSNSQVWCHRRSQSLPPRLGVKMRLPNQSDLKLLYVSPFMQTYRFHSGLGGDICVHELMAESRLCFTFPHQLLGIWIQQEKELLQEVAGMGELREPWHSRQVELLDRHLHLLRLYSQARENLQAHKGSQFKASSRKADRRLEFAPVNLHLQRMWVHNDTLNKAGFYDWITVGAFTAHSHKSKNGGLIKLVQQLKESPIRASANYQITTKISMANDAIQAIKQLRKEVVEAMKTLMKLAKEKQTNGMLPICEDMISKTRILLSLWDPGLVEEAFNFIEEYKLAVTDDSGVGEDFCSLDSQTTNKPSLILSPFKRITQQLTSLDLKSPDLDDFATPCTPRNVEDMWKVEVNKSRRGEESNLLNSSEGVKTLCSSVERQEETNFVIFPDCEEVETHCETHEEVNHESHSNGNCKTHDNDMGRMFLDTNVMCNSPSANYYKPTDEPEPWDITQLNIEASVMCLVSKVKFLCGRCGSPAVRLRQQSSSSSRTNKSMLKSVITAQPSCNKAAALGGESLSKAVTTVTQAVRNGNKFTDGLDLTKIMDWAAELRPSMRKLRQAMDGLLKTARLTHSVFRVQEDQKAAQRVCNVRYRRDVCFSQSLTALVTALMTKLWCHKADPTFVTVLSTLGPLASFEGLLSYHGNEIDMWGDMSVAIEDLRTVLFTLVRSPSPVSYDPLPQPKVTGSRTSLTVTLPVPDALYTLIPNKQVVSFHVTPVFFNIGINELATLAESVGATKPQEASNSDNFDRLYEYYLRYRKLNIGGTAANLSSGRTSASTCSQTKPLADLVEELRASVHSGKTKNVEVLHLSGQICRQMQGLRFTSCKSAKDRTGMAVTLEQCRILADEYHLAEHEFQKALDCLRSEGCRRENTLKNTNIRKYAFNSLQLLALPKHYRPPTGTYGSAQT